MKLLQLALELMSDEVLWWNWGQRLVQRLVQLFEPALLLVMEWGLLLVMEWGLLLVMEWGLLLVME